MFHTDAQQEFKQSLRAFTEAARVNYDGHAYAAGYLESLAVQMLAVMSKREQQAFIKAMREAARTQQLAAKERV